MICSAAALDIYGRQGFSRFPYIPVNFCNGQTPVDNMITRSVSFLITFLFTAVSNAASIDGKWCQDGQSYTCYPPVQHDSDTYTCTDSTTVLNSSADSLEWVINQTHYYYAAGITTGNNKPEQVRLKFKRITDPLQNIYENTSHTEDETHVRRILAKNDSLLLELTHIPDDAKAPRLNQKFSYTRCASNTKVHSFYTALVDCGGSGDYIAGVPAVVDNPLLWSQWKNFQKNTQCRIAARCWGGGWVAFAYSKDANDDTTAFGAACGGESRQDAKQQAINTCKESGGANCLYQVLSAYDHGAVDSIDGTNKGSRLESCYYGNCEQLRD
jgi:hypothetical protein